MVEKSSSGAASICMCNSWTSYHVCYAFLVAKHTEQTWNQKYHLTTIKEMCLSFFDHLIHGIDICFNKYGQSVLHMAGLVPSVIAKRDDISMTLLRYIRMTSPSPNHAEDEFIHARMMQTLQQCGIEMFPNLFVLLQIAGAFAVTSCDCGRSGSVLKRLNTYLCAFMGQERVSGLALTLILTRVLVSLPKSHELWSSSMCALKNT